MPRARSSPILDFLERPRQEDIPAAPLQNIQRILDSIRLHLGMDVAFTSEFSGGRRIFRNVSAGPGAAVRVGDSDPLEDSYCQRVIDGRLPELIRDAASIEAAVALPVTKALPVGAHLSVPLRLGDGSIYGTFCCFSHGPDLSLNQRDLAMMHAFAELAGGLIEAEVNANREREETAARIREVMERDRLSIVYQPIYRLEDGAVAGLEALARFPDCERRPPNEWFREAAAVGLGAELEAHAVKRALAGLPYIPAPLYLAINVSPRTILSGVLEKLLVGAPPDRLVVEITEHAAIHDYPGFAAALEPLRAKARLAVDDFGAGYSGMRHILDLRPNIIKLDMSLTRDIDRDAARAALAGALVTFASGIGTRIVAEGVERAGELDRLRDLGVTKAQGYYLSRPLPLMALTRLLCARGNGGPPDG